MHHMEILDLSAPVIITLAILEITFWFIVGYLLFRKFRKNKKRNKWHTENEWQ